MAHRPEPPGRPTRAPAAATAGAPRHHDVVSFAAAERNRRQATVRATAMVFEDPVSQALRRDLERLGPGDVTVLINGETGTGKELAARYLHAHSRRAGGPFVAVNCGALSEALAEAELFGHEKGAFTGALRTQRGWFEAAHGGTLLLDEIADLPLGLQVKLLRVLQEREVFRVGSRTPIPIDVRVIAATNVDLLSAVQARRFREDLFFRLNVAAVRLPPLRQRRGDIPPLAAYFLELYSARLQRDGLTLGDGVLALLDRYAWPGNIRELENVIHHAVLLAPGPSIQATDLRLSHAVEALRPSSTKAEAEAEATADLETTVRRAVERAIVDGEPAVFERVQRSVIRAAFDLAGGNQVMASSHLQISRNALRTQLAHLGVIPSRRRAPVRPRELRIGVQKFGTSSLLKARGTVEHRLAALGIRVTWREFPAGPQLLDALSRGTVEFCGTGEAPPIFAQAAGVPFVYVGHDPPSPAGEAVLVRGDSPIADVAGLRGRTVAFSRGSNVHYFLLRALAAHGLSFDDVRPVFLLPDEASERLRDGSVDAWAIWDPLLTSAQVHGSARPLLDGRGLVPNRQFFLASRAFARDNPDAVAVLLDELNAVGEYTRRHTAEVARAIAPDIGVEAAALEIALSRLAYGAKPLDDGVVDQQQEIADTLHALGLLPAPITVRDAVWRHP